MNSDWRNHPATEPQKEKLRFFGCTWDEGIMAGQASDALEECAQMFPEAEVTYQKNLPATERQKDQLRFFGCTWNGEITVAQADDALTECAKEFPGKQKEAERWFKQLDDRNEKQSKLKNDGTQNVNPQQNIGDRFQEVTIQEADETSIPAEKKQQYEIPPQTEHALPPRREGFFCGEQESQNQKSAGILTYEEARRMSQKEWVEWIAMHGSYGMEPGQKLTFGEARLLSESAWQDWKSQREIDSRVTELKSKDIYVRRRAVAALGGSESRFAVKPLIDCLADMDWGVRMQSAQLLGELKSNEAVEPLVATLKDHNFMVRNAAAMALGQIGDLRAIDALLTLNDRVEAVHKAAIVAIGQIRAKNESPKPNQQEFIIPASEVQNYFQRQAAIRKPDALQIKTPIERFEKWLKVLLERNQTIIGGHWLPVGPMSHIFAGDTITIGLCRQIADMIESKGYCVEPDARFGSGTYERDQTL
ncbi:MAG TPA: HEAT repeat domain-containing protein, partial [Candidatus Saccharimonadales bacterium]|nr:HEAT repeat domain-containing protein [Candidatus Saccharimonadales bacterium]